MLEDLNEPQRLAVEHSEGPLLILAGAGTGKTRVLTYRLAHLIENKLVKPDQVLAVTFARKAALEMATRLKKLLSQPSRIGEIPIGTFHSLSGSLLRESTNATVKLELLTEAKQLDLIKEILQKLSLSGPDWQPLEVSRKISLAKGRLLSPDDLASDNDSQLATVYRIYQHTLEKDNFLDFDDLITRLVLRWEGEPKLLSRHQSLYKMILVDEFQDVNEAQYRWLQLLAQPHRNLCVVGDTDQSIYSFRGSHIAIFQQFQEDFPEARVIKLEQNYRSSQRILQAAGEVISHNGNPLTCKLWSEADPGSPLRLGRLGDDKQEARFIVDEIERLVGGSSHYQIYQRKNLASPEESQYGFSDFAVLYRTHAQSRPLVEAFSSAGIPFQLLGEKAPFANPAADGLLAYLCYAMDTSSSKNLQVIFNYPPRGLGDKAWQWLAGEIDKGTSSWEALRLASRNRGFPVRYQAATDLLRRAIISLQNLMVELPLAELLARAWEETGLRQYFAEAASAQESFRWLYLLAGLYGDKPAVQTLPPFLDDLTQWRAGDFFDPRADAVAMMTLHAAKGLEFPVVFICGLDQDLLPLTHKNQGQEALQEERRLFYVAMTRARHRLILSTVDRRSFYGEYRTCKPSTFIKEIPDNSLEEISPPASKKKKTPKEKQLTLF
ncbi:MAG: UvrD-helicase domain-containing protein [Deltaproteobacteria bacterium]|nr:MAG: UvrD-helicase domain-containing protein [Deltaproteobacteria bacterium]